MRVRIRPIASSAFTPITESCGPVIPASSPPPFRFGCTRASFVCTCVCVPITAVTRPSSQRAIATFSLVASAWKSRMTTGACARASSTSSSTISHGDTRRVEIERAEQVQHRDLHAVARLDDGQRAPGRQRALRSPAG